MYVTFVDLLYILVTSGEGGDYTSWCYIHTEKATVRDQFGERCENRISPPRETWNLASIPLACIQGRKLMGCTYISSPQLQNLLRTIPNAGHGFRLNSTSEEFVMKQLQHHIPFWKGPKITAGSYTSSSIWLLWLDFKTEKFQKIKEKRLLVSKKKGILSDG